MRCHTMMLRRDNVSKLCVPADTARQQARGFEKRPRYPKIPRKIPRMLHTWDLSVSYIMVDHPLH